MPVKYGLTGWLLLSIAVFGLSLLHQSDSTALFGRYSISYGIQLAIILAGILISGTLAALAWRERLSWPDGLIRRAEILSHPPYIWLTSAGIILALLLFWLFMPGARGQPAILLFRVYIALHGLAALVLVLKHSDAAQKHLSDTTILVLAALFIGGMIALTEWAVGRVPRSIIFDEPWLADWGYSMFVTGKPVIISFPDQPAGYTALWSILMPVQGAWLWLTQISLSHARLFWLLICWLSAPFIYLAAKRLYGRAAALISVVIVALVPLFHNYVRPDMAVPVALSAALWLLFSARETGRNWRYYAAGFALAFAVEGHVTAARFAVAAGLLFALEYAQLIWREKRLCWYAPFWYFAAGGFTFALMFPFLHTTLWGLPVGGLFSSGSSYYAADAAFWAEYGAGQPKWWVIIQDTLINYLGFSPFELALLLLAIIAAFWKRNTNSRYLAALVLLAFVVSLVTLPKTSRYYFIHNLPFVALLGGAFLAQIVQKLAPEKDRVSMAQILLIGAGIMLMVAQLYIMSVDGQSVDSAIAAGYEANAVLPEETAPIMGRQFYYWGLHAHEFIALEDLINYIPLDERRAHLEKLAPQGFLMTPGLDQDQTYIYDYIADHDFVAARCFPLDIYQQMAVLYLPRDVLPDAAPCVEGQP